MSWSTTDIPEQSGRVALVTGATSGLGKQSALQLARRGATVVVAGRDEAGVAATAHELSADAQVRAAGGAVEPLLVDLASVDSIALAGTRFAERHQRLHILLNNAGVQSFRYARTADGIEQHIGVNYVGAFALTAALMPAITRTPEARVTSVTSIAYKWGDPEQHPDEWFDAAPKPNADGAPSTSFRDRFAYSKSAYSNSKLAVVLFATELDARFRAAGLSALATLAHPGATSTNLLRDWPGWTAPAYFGISRALRAAHPVDRAALSLLRAATDPQAEAGVVYAPKGPIKEMAGAATAFPIDSKAAAATEAARRLWSATEARLGYAVEIAHHG